VPTIAANQKPIPTRMPIAAVTQMEAAAPQARRNLWRAPGVSQPEPLGLLRIVLEGSRDPAIEQCRARAGFSFVFRPCTH
jgi:hypothetical protein